ncbi:MAG: mannosyltransferase B-like protein [Candidatus Peregrinibacteria bacterium GW2011_GWA2_44_7]|nr:MAG: mannosyltransferase B-like protein [Candidatus Peregrinibacteria bacterium GW2011_GWA2_44_7]
MMKASTPPKKRIGIDARMYSSQFTGIGRYVYELTEHLFKMDPRNDYVLFMNDPEYSAFTPPRAGVKKVLVNARHYSFAEQFHFWRILQKEKLDLMHFTHFNTPLLYRSRSLVTIHDLTLSLFPGKKMTSWIHRLAYNMVIHDSVRKVARVIAVSKNTKMDLERLLHANLKKIRVIYEGVNPQFKPTQDNALVDRVLKKYRIQRPFLLYTGVWRNHKNLVRLLEAIQILRERHGFKGQLVMTGREDPFYPEISSTIKKLGLEKNIIKTGLVSEEELVVLYGTARLYVLTSLYEGFGLPPLEAMACGTPVAVSRVSCLPEICGEDNAVFFDPILPESIAEGLHALWSNDELHHRLSRRGLAWVKQFSWEQMAKETLNVYDKVLNSPH